MKRVKKTFTLIELLVVIAIIAILAAMLLPTLNKSKDRSHTAECLSSLKQVGYFISMYSDENSEKYPPQTINNDLKSNDWAKALAQVYMPGKEYKDYYKTFACPAKVPAYPTTLDPWGVTYGMNSFIASASTNSGVYGTQDYTHANPIFWKQPSKTILLCDSPSPALINAGYLVYGDLYTYKWGHNSASGTNILCLDGHGEFVSTNGVTKQIDTTTALAYFSDYYIWYEWDVTRGPFN